METVSSQPAAAPPPVPAAAPHSTPAPGPDPGPGADPQAPPPAPPAPAWRYWRRSLLLAVVVAVLLVLSWLDERRLPDAPAAPGAAQTSLAPGAPRN